EPGVDRGHDVLRRGPDRWRHPGPDGLTPRPDRQDALQRRRAPGLGVQRRNVLKGRGTFQKRQIVDGNLEISAGGATDDERLLDWVEESRVVLPMLDAMVRNGHQGEDRLRRALEDLRRRVEAL